MKSSAAESIVESEQAPDNFRWNDYVVVVDLKERFGSLLQKFVFLSGDCDFVAAGVLAAAADRVGSTQADFQKGSLRRAHKQKRRLIQALWLARLRTLLRINKP